MTIRGLFAILSIASCAAFVPAAGAAPAHPDLPGLTISSADLEFMLRTSQADRLQVDAAKLVLGSSPSPAVARVARAAMDEHAAAERRLKRLARSVGVVLPKHQGSREKSLLSSLRGVKRLGPARKFERQYVTRVLLEKQKEEMLDCHAAALGRGRDGRLRRFAIDRMASLEKRLADAGTVATALRDSPQVQANALGGEAAVIDAEGDATLRPPARRRPQP